MCARSAKKNGVFLKEKKMTQEQFKEIKSKSWELCVRDCSAWAEENTKEKERNLYIPLSLALNSKLEGNEYLIMSYKYTNFEKDYSLLIYKYFDSDPIDSLCDMMITAMNAGASFNDEECAKMLECDYPTHSDITFLLEEKYNVDAFNVFTHFEISRLVFSLIKKGYDTYLCLLEKLKEIETRGGAFEYKACYCKCKIKDRK